MADNPIADAPILEDFVPFSPPLIGEDEIREVTETLKSGWLTTGPRTERFEAAVCEYCGVKQAVATSSCTAALHLALQVLGVGEGDGVITTPYTFASTGHVIMYQRARPFFVDVESRTFNLDPDLVERFLKDECECFRESPPKHRKTGITIKTILPVHYGGHPCRMDELINIAKKYHLSVVEDAAHAIGAKYKNRPIGSIGHITCFSFYATKNLTTGEGGMAVTNDDGLAARIRVLGMYGISDARQIWNRYAPRGTWAYDVAELGFKYNMPDILAAVGLHQLRQLDHFVSRRAENASIYREELAGVPSVTLPATQDYAQSAWHLYPLLLDSRIDRDQCIENLRKMNLGTSVLFIPLHLHSFYQRELPYREGDFPIAEDLFKRVINIPISPAVPASTIRKAARTVAKVVREETK